MIIPATSIDRARSRGPPVGRAGRSQKFDVSLDIIKDTNTMDDNQIPSNCITLRDHHVRMARELGQFTELVVYDRQNRGAEFVADLLRRAGLTVDVDYVSGQVPLPKCDA